MSQELFNEKSRITWDEAFVQKHGEYFKEQPTLPKFPVMKRIRKLEGRQLDGASHPQEVTIVVPKSVDQSGELALSGAWFRLAKPDDI